MGIASCRFWRRGLLRAVSSGLFRFGVGLPILFLEIGLGQYHQTGDVGAFGSFNKRLRGIGVCSIGGTYIARPVYGILFAWILRAFFESFSDESPWDNEE